jgi:hypothetical protein
MRRPETAQIHRAANESGVTLTISANGFIDRRNLFSATSVPTDAWSKWFVDVGLWAIRVLTRADVRTPQLT